ncbi:recombinase family protein [Clostridium gasigenes]|uniref:recombinase family protein n=2 Tax=Clostridium gasigenes TaxID=94869 RepID=UPI001A917211|nr:recombinase family protein [Clostridium gasigenes]QSW18580.1 recombinase family protein [Clostridium gasigenes]
MALIGYARVSKKDQNLDRQVDQLKEYGIPKRNMYVEKYSGTSKDRPMLKKMLEELESNDIVVVVDITRISRSSKDLLGLVDEIKEKGASIKSLKDTWLDTTNSNPYSTFLLTVMSGLSQLERELISSRTKEGLESARKRGKVGGRPKVDNVNIQRALILYEDKKLSINDICTMCGISKNTLYNYVRKEKSLDEFDKQ